MKVSKGRLAGVAATVLAVVAFTSPASALDIVLNDVASDRVERQRAFLRDELPLPNTPDLGNLDRRLAERGLAQGRPIYIRIFKETSELELWMQNGSGRFSLLANYPICHWTGSLGPKLKEGDKQSPEGFYSVGHRQTRLVGRWRKAFNLGFPNRHDQLLDRTGSHILIHGGCSSVGCFAMTNQVQEEIYSLATAALKGGQERFQVHVFPFRMTPENLHRHAGHPWAHTWADMKPAYDSFERTHVPPMVALCGVRYQVFDGLPGEAGGTDRRLPVLTPVSAAGSDQGDPSVVLDRNGRWISPGCEFGDEERRRTVKAEFANWAAIAADAMASRHHESRGEGEVTAASSTVDTIDTIEEVAPPAAPSDQASEDAATRSSGKRPHRRARTPSRPGVTTGSLPIGTTKLHREAFGSEIPLGQGG